MSANETVIVKFSGPFAWSPRADAPSVFEDPAGRLAGLYLWTVDTPHGELVYYVGETGRTFRGRLFEHLKEHLSGAYRVHDADAFKRGEKLSLWNGMFGRNRQLAVHDLLSTYENLTGPILALAQAYRFFLAPLDCSRRIRERAEAAILDHLYATTEAGVAFLDPGIRYRRRHDPELPVTLSITAPRTLLGIPPSLQA